MDEQCLRCVTGSKGNFCTFCLFVDTRDWDWGESRSHTLFLFVAMKGREAYLGPMLCPKSVWLPSVQEHSKQSNKVLSKVNYDPVPTWFKNPSRVTRGGCERTRDALKIHLWSVYLNHYQRWDNKTSLILFWLKIFSLTRVIVRQKKKSKSIFGYWYLLIPLQLKKWNFTVLLKLVINKLQYYYYHSYPLKILAPCEGLHCQHIRKKKTNCLFFF